MIAAADSLHLPFADASADAALTSPPYFGSLRAYEGAQVRPWPAIAYSPMPGLPPVEIPAQDVALGHEPDPYAYVGHLLQVFREVRRVLRPAAALAVNLGDCYASGGGSGAQGPNGQRADRTFTAPGRAADRIAGLRAKNLLLMPWRFALAMQADGWILRSRMPGGAEVMPGDDVGIEPDIVWKKPSCMPASVRDRPTVDFEDVLIFSRGPRYFWDQGAGRERAEGTDRGFRNPPAPKTKTAMISTTRNAGAGSTLGMHHLTTDRNMRSVWTINPEKTDEEHFAAWPVALAARLIRVLTSERGVCPECGAPWVREVERQRRIDGVPADGIGSWDTGEGAPTLGAQGIGHWRYITTSEDLGFHPSCRHDADPLPATVLDPFAGLGRTWEAARETDRRFIGIDLGLRYCYMARSRNDLAAKQRRKLAERGKGFAGPLFEGLGG